MRHRRRPNLASDNPLFEVVHGDVGPDIAVQIDEHGVNATQGIAPRGQVIVGFNLRGHRRARQPQDVFHKYPSEGQPINVRIGHMMGIELPRSTSKFCRIRRFGQGCPLTSQSIHKHLKLFPQSHWGGRLTMGTGQHGDFLPLQSETREIVNDGIQQGQNDAFRGSFHGERYCCVVHVLGRQPEMNKLLPCPHTQTLHAVLDKILHRLDVMVGHPFLVLHPLRILVRKIPIDVAKVLDALVREIVQLRHMRCKRNEILNLHLHAVVNEAKFRHPGRKRFSVAAVPAVDG